MFLLSLSAKIDGVIYSTTGTLPTTAPTAKTVYFTKNITTESGYNCYIRLRYEPSPGMIYADIGLSPNSSSLTAVSSITLGYMKLEYGSIATEFRKPNTADELSRCQRYFQIIGNYENYGNFAIGQATSTTLLYAFVNLLREMRIKPTITLSGNIRFRQQTADGVATITGFSITTTNYSGNSVLLSLTTSGLTTGAMGSFGANNDKTACIKLDANLY